MIQAFLLEETGLKITETLYLDSIGKPLFERGLQGQYPPGSTFKLINALLVYKKI